MARSVGVMVEFTSDAGHATVRWVRTVFAIVDHSSDIKTVQDWGRLAGVSPSVLRAICFLADAAPKPSLDFGRILRLVTQGRLDRVAESLNVDDPRTLRRLLVSAAISQSALSLGWLDIPTFISRQRFIANPVLLNGVTAELRRRAATSQPCSRCS